MDSDDILLHSQKFHRRVNDIVSEHDHLKDILKTLQIDAKVREQVTHQVEIAKQSFSGLKSDALRDIHNMIPGQVSQQITAQMPTFLNQNADMQRILAQHKTEVKLL